MVTRTISRVEVSVEALGAEYVLSPMEPHALGLNATSVASVSPRPTRARPILWVAPVPATSPQGASSPSLR